MSSVEEFMLTVFNIIFASSVKYCEVDKIVMNKVVCRWPTNTVCLAFSRDVQKTEIWFGFGF